MKFGLYKTVFSAKMIGVMTNASSLTASKTSAVTGVPSSYENLAVYKGKKVMKGYQNALNKLAKAGIKPKNVPAKMVNGFSGMTREIDGFSWSICNIILFVALSDLIGRDIQVTDDSGKPLGLLRLTQQDFDNLRYFLMVHESQVYYDFID